MAALVVVVGVLGAVQTALAAVQFNYFYVIAFPSSVTLEWSTAREVNLAGFDIQCKRADEPDTAFHEIGFERARGGPTVGALYSFPVTSGVVPGVSYCFRLKEITTDGSPGDVIDRCGYGPMVTPTPGMGAIPVFTPVPVQTDAFGNPIAPAPTVAPQPFATDAFGNPIPQPQPFATDAFGNPIQPLSPLPTPQPFATDAFGNPIPPQPQAFATDAFGNPLPPAPQPFATDVFGNPLPQPNSPLVTPQPGLASSAAPFNGQAPATDAYGNPIQPPPAAPPLATDAYGNPIQPVSPLAAAGATDAFGNPIADPLAAGMTGAFDPMAGPPATPIDPFAPPAGAFDPNTGNAIAGDPNAGVQYVQPITPTAAYIIVTATATPAPVALGPVLTPLPTVTPLPQGVQFASSLQPSGQDLAQNLMVMLLCLTFTGASGIGILGLITSVMFMRARSSQRDFYERTSIRRRL
jgi:hypothetical protein